MFSLVKANNDKSRLLNDLPLLFDDAFTKSFFEKPVRFYSTPAVNIEETEKSFELELAIPGIDKKDLKIELNKGSITISAHREHLSGEQDDKKNYSRREFNYVSFSRSFKFPEELVNQEEINAKHENGILTISIPKKTTVINQSREIQIS